MDLYERYLKGECESVYKEIEELGQDAFLPIHFREIEKVLTETFQRVSYNLKIIYAELKSRKYQFFANPLVEPLFSTSQLLLQLEASIRPFGHIPLSLQMFYRIVGSCNFGWNYLTHPDILWEESDPVQVGSLTDLIEECSDEDYLEDLSKEFHNEGYIPLSVAADYLHKDNISGGPPYSIQVTGKPAIDSLFLNEEHETTFINYLRICFKGCGFSRIDHLEFNEQFYDFYDMVKPKLKVI
jgi:hypothetical protein